MGKKRIKVNWGVIILLSMLISFLIYNIYRNAQLNTSYKYTVAKVIKIEAAADGGSQSAIFNYKVNGKFYEGFVPINYDTYIKIGSKFYIKFYTKNPNNSELTEKPFVDTLKAIPTNGWDKIP